MKLWQRASLLRKTFYVILVFIACVLLLIVYFGGVHYYTYNLYAPSSTEQGTANSGFRLSVYPEFVSGGSSGVKCVIPYLFYRKWTPFKETQIVVKTKRGSDYYGYKGKSKLFLETLVVRNENGQVFDLVSVESPKVISLIDYQSNQGSEYLGKADGKFLNITATGYVIGVAGEVNRFAQEQSWAVTQSSRIGFGVTFSE